MREVEAGVEQTSRRVSRLWQATTAVLALLLAGSVFWALQERGRVDDAQRSVSDSQAAALAASSFVESLLTYDFEALDDQAEAIASRSTERFQEDYESAFTDELREAIVAEEASSSVTVRDVFVTTDGDGRVRVIVHATSAVSSARGAGADVESYLEMLLVRVDGRWLVDEMTSLGSRDLGQVEERGGG